MRMNRSARSQQSSARAPRFWRRVSATRLLLLGFVSWTAAGPFSSRGSIAVAAVPSAAGDVVVTWSDNRQKISGFGAAAVFFAPDMSPEDADFLFSPSRGIGLSLLRVSVGQDGTCPEIESAKKAQYYGARVWASSWTPPAEWKTNNALNAMPKAHLIASHYADFANLIAGYIEWMNAQGVPILAVSPQNEPDWEASWDGCLWTAAELTTFIRDNLGPTLAMRNLKTLIMAPDTASWNNMDGFVTALMNDASAKPYVSIIATHPYGVGSLTYTKPADNGKEFWETEVSQEKMPLDTPDPTMTSALTMVAMIHDHLLTTQMNAWNWWASIGPEVLDDPVRQNPALIQNGTKYKRAYALGNFAKFIRPGWTRLGATELPATGIRVSAYRDAATSRLSIVAVNAGTSARTQKFWVDGQPIGTITPWVTSDSASLARQAALAAATDNFSYSLPARSIVTFANWNADDQPGPAVPPPTTPDGGSTLPGADAGVAGDAPATETRTDNGGASGGVADAAGGSTGTSGGSTGTGGSFLGGTGGSGGLSGNTASGTGGASAGTGGLSGDPRSGTGGASSGTGSNQQPGGASSPKGCACSTGGPEMSLPSLLVAFSVFALAFIGRSRRRRGADS
jgi:glucuronoarabinoxylan endo-1,4-beta-xylanase